MKQKFTDDVLVKRSTPAVESTYGRYRETLRFDFYYSCAYCSIAEIEASAISFEIDHYKPQHTGESDVHDYENLMWSCEHCNNAGSKGGFWPSAEQLDKGQRILRPDKDVLHHHYHLNGDELEHDTEAGDTTITMLRLNRRALTRLRNIRARLYHSQYAIMAGMQALQGIPLDLCPPELRIRLRKVQVDVDNQQKELEAALDAVTVRGFNRSPNADLDPDAGRHTAARRRYLDSVKALLPKE